MAIEWSSMTRMMTGATHDSVPAARCGAALPAAPHGGARCPRRASAGPRRFLGNAKLRGEVMAKSMGKSMGKSTQNL